MFFHMCEHAVFICYTTNNQFTLLCHIIGSSTQLIEYTCVHSPSEHYTSRAFKSSSHTHGGTDVWTCEEAMSGALKVIPRRLSVDMKLSIDSQTCSYYSHLLWLNNYWLVELQFVGCSAWPSRRGKVC